MLVLNEGTDREFTLRVVLESEDFGRECFDHYESLDQALEAVKRLVNNAAESAATDGVERVVGISIVPKAAYRSDGNGFGVETTT